MIKNELEFLIEIQKDYYISISRKGDESWAQGLIWVIERLSDIGVEITFEMLPDFIDN